MTFSHISSSPSNPFRTHYIGVALLSHSRNCVQLHLQFVLITEDGSTKSNYDAWLIGRLLHLLFPFQSGFTEAVAHQS